MKPRALIILVTAVLVLTWGLSPVFAKGSMVAPVVSLDRVEIQNYFGFWHGTKEKPADKGSCPIVWAFVFNVSNPNSIPVQMDSMQFTYAFDGYDITTPQYANPMWIPAGKVSQVRVVSLIATGALAGSLAVTSGFKMKERGDSAGGLLKKWWTEAPDMSYPITVSGSANFSYEGGSVISSFEGKFGGK